MPTRIPPTPTPRSTALPPATPAPVIGSPERPIEVLIAIDDDALGNSVRQAATALQDALATSLGQDIRVRLVNENEALLELCSGKPAAAWVNPFTYAAAQRTCNVEPVFAVKKGRPPSTTIGLTSEIVSTTEIASITDLQGKVFCRSEAQDRLIAWGIPALLLSAQGLDPFQDLALIRDYPDDVSLLAALYTGECSAGAITPDKLDQLMSDLLDLLNEDADETVSADDVRSALHTLVPAADVTAPPSVANWSGFETGTVPFATLVLPPLHALPAEYRDRLVDAIEDSFTERGAGEQRAELLLGADGIMPVQRDDYRQFISLLEKTNWNMALAN